MESFFTGSVKSYRLISPAQLAHPGHGSTSALHRTICVMDGQSLSCISKVLKILAKLQHYLISGHSSRHQNMRMRRMIPQPASTTSLWSGARNISTSHTFTPITFCNCKLVCCKYKWKNINGTLNLLLQFLKITFSQFPPEQVSCDPTG